MYVSSKNIAGIVLTFGKSIKNLYLDISSPITFDLTGMTLFRSKTMEKRADHEQEKQKVIQKINEKYPNAPNNQKEVTLNKFLYQALRLKLKKAVTFAEIERLNQLLNDDDLTNDGPARDEFYQRIGMDGEFFRRRGD